MDSRLTEVGGAISGGNRCTPAFGKNENLLRVYLMLHKGKHVEAWCHLIMLGY